MRSSRQIRNDSSNRTPNAIPLLHRGVIVLGLALLGIWITLQAITSVVTPVVPIFPESTRDLSNILQILATAFLAFGGACELILCAVLRTKENKDEGERLADLCGRSRFDRCKKKYKRVRIKKEEPTASRPLADSLGH